MDRGVRSSMGNGSALALVTGNYRDFEHLSGITLAPLGA
jgi:hypothetical protein